MVVASAISFWVALVLYCAGACFYAYQFVLRKQSIGTYARVLVFLGFIAQTASIGFTSIATEGTLLTGPNVISLASWVVILVYCIFELIIRVKAYGAFLVPVAVILMSVGRVLTSLNFEWANNSIVYSTPLLSFHIIVLLIGFAAFIIAGVSAGMLLYQENLLKNHKSTQIGRRIPALATLKRVSRQSILFGFPFVTVGMFIGIIMSAGQDYPQWYFAPRIILVALIWVVYGIYLLQIYRESASVKSSSYIAMLGAFLTIALLIVLGMFPMFGPTA